MWGSASSGGGQTAYANFESMPWNEVIGVVEDVRENGVQAAPPETVYWPTMVVGSLWQQRTQVMRR